MFSKLAALQVMSKSKLKPNILTLDKRHNKKQIISYVYMNL